MKPLKIGLLLDGVRCDKYVHELALWGKSQANLDVSHLILHRRRAHSRRGGLRRLPAKIVFRVIRSIETILLRRSGAHRDHYRSFDLSKIIGQTVEIEPLVSRSGHVYRFSKEDIDRLKSLELDLLIRCGQGILRGDILRASRLGVLSFHHGDNRVNRGGPAGFWECYYQWPETGFIIQRLTEELDAGEVLVRGAFATRYYYSLNQAHVYKKSLSHLKNLLAKVAATGRLPEPDPTPAPYSNRLFRAPGLVQCAAYGCKLLSRLSVKALASVLPRERWGISVLSAKWNEAAFWRSREALPPRGRFWADPFLHTREGRTYCFVEDYVYEAGRAHISALEIVGTKIVERGVALKEPFHLSFPFLFEHLGELYMCPESCAAGQIRVYRCTQFPLEWKLEKVLMEGVCAVDTMLLNKGGRWWMFTTIDESGTGDHCSELYLFSSDSPLSSTWTPHAQNPLRIDSRGGRNAGLIVEGQKIFRLAQCQGFDRYGHSLLAYEIVELSESRYAETLVATIAPNFRKGLLGTHHLSTDGKTTVIDHISHSFAL
jgi:hypothetical protein